MKEIKIVINNGENKSIIISALNDDDTEIKKVIPQNQITAKDIKFLLDLEALISQNYGG